MTPDELADDLARKLLASPGKYHILIWRLGGDWGWGFGGDPVPEGAKVVFNDWTDRSDQEPTDDPEALADFAASLREWISGSFTVADFPSGNGQNSPGKEP